MIDTGIFEIKNVQGHLQNLESLRPLKYRKEVFKVTTVYIVLSLDHRHPLTHARYAGWHVGQQQTYSTPVYSVSVVNCPSGVMEGVLSSPSTVQCQVFFGRPCSRFPFGVERRAVREMLSGSHLVTCLIHLHMMMVTMLSWWKVDSFLRSLSVILQHSEPYRRVESTKLWYSLSLFLVKYWDGSNTLFSILKTFLALLRRFVMSLPAPPSCLNDSATEVGEFFSCSKIISIHFDRLGVWNI